MPRRISAPAIEGFLAGRLARLLTAGEPGDHLQRITRVEVLAGRIKIHVPVEHIGNYSAALGVGDSAAPSAQDRHTMILSLACRFSARRSWTEVVDGNQRRPRPDRSLIRALRAAHAVLGRDASGLPTLDAAPQTSHRHRIIRLAFLAPEIQAAILAGTQPRSMTLASLIRGTIPPLWADQLRTFGMK